MQPQISMIVQLRLSERWGSDEEIEERDEIGEVIGTELEKRGCGYFDGRDTGGGATNLLLCNIPEEAWEEALGVALDELKRRQALDKAVIAKSVFNARGPEPQIEHSVCWPPSFSAGVRHLSLEWRFWLASPLGRLLSPSHRNNVFRRRRHVPTTLHARTP